MKKIKLKNALWGLNITQREAADKSGVPEGYLSMYIHGKFNLSEDQKNKISQALDLPQKDLFEEVIPLCTE